MPELHSKQEVELHSKQEVELHSKQVDENEAAMREILGPAAVKRMLQRLDRQDNHNTVLEEKYAAVSTELRESRRAFMRERQLWREQRNRVKAALRASGKPDPSVLEILDRDVEFFSGEQSSKENDPDKLREKYEDMIAELKQDHEQVIATMEDIIEQCKGKITLLEDRIEEMEKARRIPVIMPLQ